MKQNTKFLWMYICILFSFAVILIIFAGLSSNTETEQEKSMERDITVLSKTNTELNNQNTELQKQIEQKNIEIGNLTSEKKQLLEKDSAYEANEVLLTQAIAEHDKKNDEACKGYTDQINPETLTQTQLYLYNYLLKH